eukprot:394323-Alexandrium_andersonii.AAC.1
MSASLVGSEMCIRDRGPRPSTEALGANCPTLTRGASDAPPGAASRAGACLLYTSDAADDM